MNNKKWVVYLVLCSDKSLYCGISNDLKSRVIEHNLGKGAKYTRSRRPVDLVAVSPEMTKSDALKLEYRIKRLPANKKMSKLTSKENGMTISKKDLQSLQEEIKAIGKKMEKLIATVEKSEKAKTTKRAPAKKATAKKKPAQPTATDQVLKIINKSKKGVNIKTLMDKTSFNQKKVTNILQRTFKQGKIKRVGKGIYMGA
jgi:putative endonuclease